MVERCPEEAGVASSILALGTQNKFIFDTENRFKIIVFEILKKYLGDTMV